MPPRTDIPLLVRHDPYLRQDPDESDRGRVKVAFATVREAVRRALIARIWGKTPILQN